MATGTNGKHPWQNRIIESGEMPAIEFLANPDNWRIHPRNQQEALGGVLDSVGWVQEVIVNKQTGHLIDGHLRVTLALRQGEHTPVPYKLVDLTPEEEALILATLDPIAAFAATDREKLDAVMRNIQSDDARVQALMADIAEREKLEYGRKPAEDPGAQIDKADELRQKWGVELGQLWQLGEHRLICGDCTDRAAVDRVMAGEKAGAVVTDPPYGINREGIENDDPEGLRELFDGCLEAMPITDAVVIAFQSPRLFPEWLDASRAHGHKFERSLWFYDETDVTFPWRGWLMTSQIALVSSIGTPRWSEGEYHHDCYIVKTAGKQDDSGGHTTAKPLDIVENLVAHTTGIVYDPFLGSGTTLIACERLGRKCRAVEISPAYCAVAIQRWVDMTGGIPHLEGVGQSDAD